MFRTQLTELQDGGTLVQVVGDYSYFDGRSPILWETRAASSDNAKQLAGEAIADAFRRLFDAVSRGNRREDAGAGAE